MELAHQACYSHKIVVYPRNSALGVHCYFKSVKVEASPEKVVLPQRCFYLFAMGIWIPRQGQVIPGYSSPYHQVRLGMDMLLE